MKTRQIILYRKPARIRTRSIILARTSKYIRKRRLCAENGLPSSVFVLYQVCCMLYRGVPLYLLPLAAAAAVVCSNAIVICASNIRRHRQMNCYLHVLRPFDAACVIISCPLTYYQLLRPMILQQPQPTYKKGFEATAIMIQHSSSTAYLCSSFGTRS